MNRGRRSAGRRRGGRSCAIGLRNGAGPTCHRDTEENGYRGGSLATAFIARRACDVGCRTDGDQCVRIYQTDQNVRKLEISFIKYCLTKLLNFNLKWLHAQNRPQIYKSSRSKLQSGSRAIPTRRTPPPLATCPVAKAPTDCPVGSRHSYPSIYSRPRKNNKNSQENKTTQPSERERRTVAEMPLPAFLVAAARPAVLVAAAVTAAKAASFARYRCRHLRRIPNH